MEDDNIKLKLISIQILLQYIRADRDSDWQLHISTHVAILPYFFACNKPNYSRWGTLNALDMLLKLPEFLAGYFSVNFSVGSFRYLFTDFATEMSVIKDTKYDTGIVGLTRKEPAVLRWTLTANVLGKYCTVMESRNCKNDNMSENFVLEGEREAALNRDENDIMKILKYICQNSHDCSFLFNHKISTTLVVVL